ncbi:MAG: elongation factor Ts [Melioribacteraceae bacterium]|nr:elongation factor Ts [Melioribacteraceae bacterium]
MAISAKDVKELRDKTGAGMMDCKKALTEADGDFEKAIEVLRKKGAAVAAKRADRSANEGIVITKVLDGGKTAIMVEVNCETDFVAKSDDFVNFSEFVLKVIVENKPANIEELLALVVDGKNVGEELTAITGRIGEKIEISRFIIETAENGVVVDYIHHGAKLGVLIKLEGDNSDELVALGKDFAMQVAAMNPPYVNKEAVPAEIVQKEIELYKEIAKNEGKPEQILEKIAQGRLGKFYSENCLVEQSSVKDNSKSVNDFVKEYNTKNSKEVSLVLFHRFHLSDENK